jgi:hypothetical protein
MHLYVLEYSQSQKSWHIHTLQEMAETNLKIFIDGKQLEYTPVAYGTMEEMRDLSVTLERYTDVEGLD